jgi:hypothetical protein
VQKGSEKGNYKNKDILLNDKNKRKLINFKYRGELLNYKKNFWLVQSQILLFLNKNQSKILLKTPLAQLPAINVLTTLLLTLAPSRIFLQMFVHVQSCHICNGFVVPYVIKT